MTTKKLTLRQKILVAGTLFGMFFGAGNLIFPVHLGQMAGQNALPAIIGFIINPLFLFFFAVLMLAALLAPARRSPWSSRWRPIGATHSSPHALRAMQIRKDERNEMKSASHSSYHQWPSEGCGSELTANCSQLKMRSADNKRYMTDENLVTMPVTRFFLCSKFQFSPIFPLTAKFPLRAGGGFLFHTYPV